jgi:hypothetical protein
MYFVSVPYPVNYEDLVDELEELRVGQESVSSPGGATGYTSDPTPCFPINFLLVTIIHTKTYYPD